MPLHPYQPPVDSLLSYGPCEGRHVRDWPNYGQELGLTADHIPALIQMAQDGDLWAFFEDDDRDAEAFVAAGLDPAQLAWAPLHAIRTLGQLRAVEAIQALVQVLEQRDYDWCWEEIPHAIGLMGAEALDPIEALLATKINYNHKISLVEAIGHIAKADPDLRDRCVEILTRQLSRYKNHHRSVNGALVTELYHLKAIESAAVMEEAYQAKKVDEMFAGSWPRVQVDLGLKQESDFTPDDLSIHYTLAQQTMMDNLRASLDKLKQIPAPAPFLEFKDLAPQGQAETLGNKAGFGSTAKGSPKKGKKKKK
ncbi:MAG: hypothetical protein VKI82_11350 [Leptolyngbya sp.]|nr:hypothetical protein [Leptolyngbya sp.]